MAQNILQQKKYTIQDGVRQGHGVGVGLLFWLAQAGQIIAPWWSKRRDEQLRDFWKDSAHYSGATYMMSSKIAGIPFRVEPRDATVKQHLRMADEFNGLLDEAPQYGQGWSTFWGLFLEDIWNSDNGAFGEVIGDGNPLGPIKGPPLGLAHLDSYNVQRTSDPEFPIIYTDVSGDGKRYKLHYTRCIYASQMPSTASEMHGVGVCWLSRAINSVQNLVDISIYKQEKLGSRPMRGIIYGSNISTDSILNTIAMAEESMDNQGLSRYAKMAVMGDENRDIALNLLELAGLPDGFDEKTATDLAMFVIALAGGFPPRWLWPASTVGATKADAMYQHVAGSGGGLSWHLNLITRLLGGSSRGLRHSTGKFLPPILRLVFDYQDDEQDRLQAEIRSTRAETRKIDLEDATIDVRTAREQALAAGDLTRAQFTRLELEDGRLENGDDVLSLFGNPEYSQLLSLNLQEPLLIEQNDPQAAMAEINAAHLKLNAALTTSGTARERSRLQQAIAALDKLMRLYQESKSEKPSQTEETETEMDFDNNEIIDELGAKSKKKLSTKAGGTDNYRRLIRSAVRGLWTGALDFNSFWESMSSAINIGLNGAWAAGARECGITMDELTAAERAALQRRINYEHLWITGYAEAIEENRASGGKLSSLYSRAEIWIGRWDGVRSEARALACADLKLKWELGEAEHCASCLKLAGKVKRGSFWAERGIFPRIHGASYLECRGFRCRCSLVPTEEPLSKGPLPNLP